MGRYMAILNSIPYTYIKELGAGYIGREKNKIIKTIVAA